MVLVFCAFLARELRALAGALPDVEAAAEMYAALGDFEDAAEQLLAIRVLKEADLLDKLPEKIKQAASARENNPSASLSELAAMMEPAITKPAMNNRMKKLVQMAKEISK